MLPRSIGKPNREQEHIRINQEVRAPNCPPLRLPSCHTTTPSLLADLAHMTEVRIGERFRVGSAELIVTQPRTPCYKLGLLLSLGARRCYLRPSM